MQRTGLATLPCTKLRITVIWRWCRRCAKPVRGFVLVCACVESVCQAVCVCTGGDIDAKGWNGWTPMHSAAWQGYLNVVQALFEAGPCRLFPQCATTCVLLFGELFHFYLSCCWCDVCVCVCVCVRYTVPTGGDPTATNGGGQTPLDVAKKDDVKTYLSTCGGGGGGSARSLSFSLSLVHSLSLSGCPVGFFDELYCVILVALTLSLTCLCL